jgi:hypothetical protein
VCRVRASGWGAPDTTTDGTARVVDAIVAHDRIQPEHVGAAHGAGVRDVGIDLEPWIGAFHPKINLACRGSDSVAVIGSANLTGGLVSNVEAAVMLRGHVTDEPICAAWEFAETLWSDPRRTPWTLADEPVEGEVFEPGLYALLQAAFERHDGLFTTLDQGKPIGSRRLRQRDSTSRLRRVEPRATNRS